MNKLNTALIKLTHSVIDETTGPRVDTKDFINRGLIFVDDKGLVETLSEEVALKVARDLNRIYDIWNRHFHQTWEKIADAPIEQLAWEQIVHYFSTYGLESIGMKACPTIPCEEMFDDVKMRPDSVKAFTVVTVVNEKDAILLLNDYVKSAKKPNLENIALVAEVIDRLTVTADEIPSFEIKCLYYRANKIAPTDGQDFLRYLIYVTTKSTLVIKNRDYIESIKRNLKYESSTADEVADLFKKADLVELSKIFLRNKALFLAFKEDKRNAPVINKIRRLAVNNHQPLSEVTVANVMNLLGQNKKDEVLKVIKKTSNRNLIKLLNTANNDETSDRIYNIRNGKVFVNTKEIDKTKTHWLYKECLKQLSINLSGKLAGQTFYIPEGVDYKAPISEKQLIGNIPYGTTISADTDADAICASIAWENFKGHRTDIDFHLNSATRHFGWNGGWRSGDDVLFSGDMTDATNGATETYRFKVDDKTPYLASVNLYSGDHDCPFKVFLSAADDFRHSTGERKPMIDISKALSFPVELKFTNTNAMSIGFIIGKTFTFYGGNLGSNIVPKADLYKNALNAIVNRCKTMISLNDIITLAGGKIVTELTEEMTDVIDLAPENITEQAIFKIIDAE